MLYDVLNLLYPQICPSCNNPLLKGEDHICTQCLLRLPYTCYETYEGNPLTRSFSGMAPIREASALCHFRSGSRIQRVLHDLKYNGNRSLAVHMGELLGESLVRSPSFSSIEMIVPVPLHPKKLRSRGYNQATAIAEGVAQIVGADVSEDLLVRRDHNRSQTKKSRFDRWRTIKESFDVKSAAGIGKVMVVDDVITTGATIGVCADLVYQNLKEPDVFVAAIACA